MATSVPPHPSQLIEEISELRTRHKAVILAHNYELAEVQDIADFTGDSLELSRRAAVVEAEVIVFCGVHFMAETAAILAPGRTVLLPVAEAGCPMADMITPEELLAFQADHPGAVTVTYVNSTAEIKALSDLCCTSANARAVVESIPVDRTILFVPDRHLGEWVTRGMDRQVVFWPGFCPVHQRILPEDIARKRGQFPDALVMVHPECDLAVCESADFVESTGGMLRRIADLPHGTKLILGTEVGMINRLQTARPDLVMIPAGPDLVCANMKMTRLVHVRDALLHLRHRITVNPAIADRARGAIERMLAIP
ncbi:quinolinate synthase NadA [Myxococcota bacterium]|nr:quinolinate synthase NadA [Myxococcota bacterium]